MIPASFLVLACIVLVFGCVAGYLSELDRTTAIEAARCYTNQEES